MDNIGIDVHKTASQVCILTEEGELLERRIKTDRDSFGTLLGARPTARILIEASTESEWVARHLEEIGHEVVVADPNFAPMSATRNKRITTDRRDARARAARRVGSALIVQHIAPRTNSAISGRNWRCVRRWCAPAPSIFRWSER